MIDVTVEWNWNCDGLGGLFDKLFGDFCCNKPQVMLDNLYVGGFHDTR